MYITIHITHTAFQYIQNLEIGETAIPKYTKKDVHAMLMAYYQEKKRAPLRALQKSLATTLDGLNALDALAQLREKHFSPLLCHGAIARDGLTPQTWVGVMIWHRPSGYLGYKTLTVIGVWAMLDQEGKHQIIVGKKYLPFASPFYDAEAYFKLIRRGFDLYYNDDGSPPPPSGRITEFRYEPAKRLELRETLAQALLKTVTPET